MSLIKLHRRNPTFPALTPFPTFSMVDELPNRLRRLFDEALDLNPVTQAIGFMPVCEIAENPDFLVLTAELPGMTSKDIDILVDENVLVLKGKKVEEVKEGTEERKYHLWERTYGEFQRAFTLPLTVDAANITAEFADGVLMVKMPKTAEAKAKGRKIEIAEKK